MKRLQTWLLALLIFLWPSNLFLKFAESSGYLHGLLVDYLLPKLYVSDLVILAILICWGVAWWRQKKRLSVPQAVIAGMLFVAVLAVVQLTVPKPLAGFWFLAKLVEMTFLGCWLWNHRNLLREKLALSALIAMLIFQSVVGLGQFWTQSSVFPSYTWLGESRLERRAGLARGDFDHVERVLPYGTTSHPNVLAAVLVIGLLSVVLSLRERRHGNSFNFLAMGASVLAMITLGFTQSWAACISLAFGISAIYLHNTLRRREDAVQVGQRLLIAVVALFFFVPLFINYAAGELPLNTSLTRRELLNSAALKMWQQHPLTGVGLNQFTVYLEKVLPANEAVRFVQPAHHVLWLYLAETGLIGVIGGVAILKLFYSHLTERQRTVLWKTLPYVAMIFLPLAALDHYVWTQQIGQLTVVIGGVWLASAFSSPKN